MDIKKIINQLNIPAQCAKYGLSLRQCPQFLFLLMGLIIIGAVIMSYGVAERYVENREIVIFFILILTAFLFAIGVIITQSFERLAEANRMKSEFVNIVSHQLRSPLTNFKWTLDFLLSGELGEIKDKTLEYLKILKENSEKMRELLKDLLIVSRLELGEPIFFKKEVSLGEIVREVLKGYAPFAAASNIEIVFNDPQHLPMVFTDPSYLKTAVEALLDNAIRYTKGKGKIAIALTFDDRSLSFEIKDSGIGIPAGDQKYVFRKFFRSADALRHQTQGSGLGLYIAKSIVEKSGGEIGFKSKESEGSTFWFTLPIIR